HRRAARRRGGAGAGRFARARAQRARPRLRQRRRDRSRHLSPHHRPRAGGGACRMTRIVTVGAAQLGPIARAETRREVVARLVALLRQAKAMACDIVVYPELALTTFFPRWWFEDPREIDAFFEREMPGPETRALFAEAERLQLGFCLGYAELTPEGRHFNAAILVEKSGTIVGKYRKIHLPGHAEHEPWRRFQHLEKRYFEVGDLGF